MSSTYGETVYQLIQLSNPDKSVPIASTFDLLIVNRLAASNTHAFLVIATIRSMFYKAEDKLELALDLIKCVGCQYIHCDNLTEHNFMCNEISEDEFCIYIEQRRFH